MKAVILLCLIFLEATSFAQSTSKECVYDSSFEAHDFASRLVGDKGQIDYIGKTPEGTDCGLTITLRHPEYRHARGAYSLTVNGPENLPANERHIEISTLPSAANVTPSQIILIESKDWFARPVKLYKIEVEIDTYSSNPLRVHSENGYIADGQHGTEIDCRDLKLKQ